MTGASMKPPKDINVLLVECNYSLKYPRQMKGCIIMVYIQELHYDSEDKIKDSKFQWSLFVIHKLISSYMIGLYFYKQLSL